MAEVLLLIVGAILGIAIFALLIKVAVEGLKIFLENTFKFLLGILIIGAIGFSGYVIANKDKVEEQIHNVLDGSNQEPEYIQLDF